MSKVYQGPIAPDGRKPGEPKGYVPRRYTQGDWALRRNKVPSYVDLWKFVPTVKP